MSENGDNVTWRELNLALNPLKDSVREIDGKLDAVLTNLAERDGAEKARTNVWDNRRFMISTITVVVTSSFAAFLITLITRHP